MRVCNVLHDKSLQEIPSTDGQIITRPSSVADSKQTTNTFDFKIG